MLTVPEQYAGQLMKCPLCASTFTVPGLPPAPAAVPPPPPETYPVKSEPAPATPPAAPAPAASTPSTPPPAPPPPGSPMTFSLWFKPEIMQWIAPAALVLIVIFMLGFPWVGVYPGGQEAAWQYPWEIVLAWPGSDPDLQKVFHFTTDQEVKDGKEKDNRPGYGLLMLVYMPLVFLTAAVTVACAVLPSLKLKLPANIEPFLQWRWALAAGLNLFAFLILSAQLLFGFSLESTVYEWKASQFADLEKKENKTTIEQKELLVMKGEAAALATKTIYPKLVLFLHLVAIGGAALMLALERRGNKPPVRLDLVL